MTALPPPSVETLAVALREVEKRFDDRLKEMALRLDERFHAQDKAETIASRTLAAWQLAHNEVSAALSKSYSEKLPREEYTAYAQGLIEKLDKIEETLRIQIQEANRRIGLSESRLATVEGKSTGIQASIGWIIAAIALAISLYALLSGHPVEVVKSGVLP